MLTIVKGIIASAILWLVLAFTINTLGPKIFIPAELKVLAERGRPTSGKVVGKDELDDYRVDYKYSVDGTEHAGSGKGGFGNASFNELTLGTTVKIYYDPVNLEVSCLGSPEERLESHESIIKIAAIAIPFWPSLIFFLIYFAVTKARRSSQLPETD